MSDKKRTMLTVDGNEAAAYFSPTKSMRSLRFIRSRRPRRWANGPTNGRPRKSNIWGTMPDGDRNAMRRRRRRHGPWRAATGALTTTFTACQGLLLMIPNMFKIAGELTPTVFHVSARSLAAQALSIFGDHSDVMAAGRPVLRCWPPTRVARSHGFRAIAQAATLDSVCPSCISSMASALPTKSARSRELTQDDLRAMIDDDLVQGTGPRAVPDHPVMRGTAQNPDVYFQGRETVNKFYLPRRPSCRSDGQVRRHYRPAVPPVRLCGRARRRTSDRRDGFRRRSRRTRRWITWWRRAKRSAS